MLTPAFELSQNREFLTILIKAPYAKITETEIFIEENDFKFFSKPYFLRLNLPGNLVEDGRETADYDTDKGQFTIKFPKETPGEHFDGLDMLTKLLAPKGRTTAAPPVIEVIDSHVASEDGEGEVHEGLDSELADGGEDVEEFDWCIPQTPYTELPASITAPKYGFANQKSGVFARLQEELCHVVDCPDPDQLTAADRRERRLQVEQDKFDADHYLADLYEDDLIQSLIHYKAPWEEEHQSIQKGVSVEEAVELTEDEKYAMRKLPKKEYLLDSTEETSAYLGLVDIVYAYCYNHRSTEGENNVESGWTINKLSSTLSWLEVFSSMQDVVESCFRRSLCYPLYRHWSLSQTVLQDVITIFKIGRRRMLKCLLEVYSLLVDQDTRYVLNDLYIADYCVWIQATSPAKIESLADALSKVNVMKRDLNFDLVELEKLAGAAMDSDADIVGEVTDGLANISVRADRKLGDDTGDGRSEYTTDSSDSSSDSDDVTTDSDDVITDSDDVTAETGDVNNHSRNVQKDKRDLNDVTTDNDDVITGKSDATTKTDNVNEQGGNVLSGEMNLDQRQRKKVLITEVDNVL